ncbi:Protein of unknown function (DUF 258) [gamma proteobacterium HdN1]|nr:Protein of unknown function (DUF 258) [gamma proteobacterium HdN1]
MAKRRLSEQQVQRIRASRDAKVQRATQAAGACEDAPSGDEKMGLVVGHYGSFVEIEPLPITQPRCIYPCHFRASLGSQLTAGDRVVYRSGTSGPGVVEAIMDRHSLLARPDTRGMLRPVAANVDFIVLVIAASPTPSTALIDRYLVAAELQGIEVRLLLNKIDLATPNERAALQEMLAVYPTIGYTILECSAHTGEGMAALQQALEASISIFVGQSGVGKSSLVNALLPDANARVGEISSASQLGRHTTTNSRLFHFRAGGSIIDSPGIREFGLWHLQADQIVEGFREFLPFLGQCRFSDCQHRKEPGCALREAIAEGKINPARLESYFRLREKTQAP